MNGSIQPSVSELMKHSKNMLNISSYWIFLLIFIYTAYFLGTADGSQIQCYACGMPKVHPEYDVIGSYGQKLYNHSCYELNSTIVDGKVDPSYIRTCPTGVSSCFSASGIYDNVKKGQEKKNIRIHFMGCSEAKYRHQYGCDRNKQTVSVKDKVKKQVQVDINVNLCFCSEHLCNHPDSALMKATSGGQNKKFHASITLFIFLSTSLLIQY